MGGSEQPEEPAAPATSVLRQELGYLLQVVGLGAFAIAQPVLDVMGNSPETFVYRGAGALDVVLFGLAVSVLPALGLWTLAAVTRVLGPRVRWSAHLALIGALGSAIAMQVLKRATSLPDAALVAAALLAGVGLAWLIARVRAAGTWARWAAMAPAAFLAVFLFVAPVSKLLRAPEAGAAAPGARRVPVVVILFDEFPLASLLDRSGGIDATLFPNFAELAARSTWYPNYTVTEWLTRYSVPTILTGTTVQDRSLEPIAADHPDNLFSLLSETHRLEVFEPFTALCSEEICSGSPTPEVQEALAAGGLAGLASDALLVWSELSLPGTADRDITTQFTEVDEEEEAPTETAEGPLRGGGRDALHAAFIDSLDRDEEPTLHYLHSVATHVPWNRFPNGRPYQTLSGPRDDLPLTLGRGPHGVWVEEPWAVQLARQRHLLQVQYTDRILGAIMDRMREVGMFDDALLMVTSDHGGSLQPGQQRRAPTAENLHEIYWVPLLIKAPNQRVGAVDDRNLMAPDLLPTIAALLDTEVPWPTDGSSAQDRETHRGPAKTFTRRADVRSIPLPEQTFTITLEEAGRRLRDGAFSPGVECRTSRMCLHLVGPGAALVGQPLEDLPVGTHSGLSATLLLPRDLQVGADALPALILGTLDGADPADELQVAVAVDGTIAGVSTTWTKEEVPGWFGVLAPRSLLRPGPLDLRLFQLDGSVLRPIGAHA